VYWVKLNETFDHGQLLDTGYVQAFDVLMWKGRLLVACSGADVYTGGIVRYW
jgi:hypothetical protein